MPQLVQKQSSIRDLVGIYRSGSATLCFTHGVFQECLKLVVPSWLAFLGHFHSSLSPCSPTYQSSHLCLTKHKPPYPSPCLLNSHWACSLPRTLLSWAALISGFFALPFSRHSALRHGHKHMADPSLRETAYYIIGRTLLKKNIKYGYKHVAIFYLSPCWPFCHIHWDKEPLNDYIMKEVTWSRTQWGPPKYKSSLCPPCLVCRKKLESPRSSLNSKEQIHTDTNQGSEGTQKKSKIFSNIIFSQDC